MPHLTRAQQSVRPPVVYNNGSARDSCPLPPPPVRGTAFLAAAVHPKRILFRSGDFLLVAHRLGGPSRNWPFKSPCPHGILYSVLRIGQKQGVGFHGAQLVGSSHSGGCICCHRCPKYSHISPKRTSVLLSTHGNSLLLAHVERRTSPATPTRRVSCRNRGCC